LCLDLIRSAMSGPVIELFVRAVVQVEVTADLQNVELFLIPCERGIFFQ